MTIKKLLIILSILGIFSCQENKSRIETIDTEDLSSEQINDIMAEFKFQYESPIVIDSSDLVIIPISTQNYEKRNRSSKVSYYSDEYPRYWNLLFYDRRTGENRLLTEEKVNISNFHIHQNEYKAQRKSIPDKILYELIDNDFNKDGLLNGYDPTYLFSSEINGRNMKRISPLNESLLHFEVLPESDQMLLRTIRDINQDSLFTSEDESIWYKAELVNQEWEVEEIIDAAVRKKIKNLYFDQWVKKK